jgi:flagellar hook-basal body complex protein FliE
MSDPIVELAAVTADFSALARAASTPPAAPADAGAAPGASGGTSFVQALGAALDRVDGQIGAASAAAKSFAAGDRDISLSDVMISLEEANLALQTAATVRDKVAAAYTTIMNMQI